MKLIELTRGEYAKVDDCDYRFLMNFNWQVHEMRGVYYTKTSVVVQRSPKKMFWPSMHRMLTDFPVGMVVDHVNGNSLDNRRSNLRICTQAENTRNNKLGKNNTSGIKGIYRVVNKWKTLIGVDGKSVHGGTFECPLLAANKYRELARKYHGEFANLG